ncbi:MAG TPA: BfmA/BtgA family mobilization protein [Flavobacteriaceae bacterium]
MKVQFGRINFKLETVQRFRSFSKVHGKTHSEVLEGMMDFFDTYQMSPFQNFGPNIRGMEANIKKRINALIAIVKDIEKHQTQPTNTMLQLLFEQIPSKEVQADLILDGSTIHQKPETDFFDSLEAIELRKEKNTIKRELEKTREQFEDILFSKVRIITPSFGKPKLQIDMSIEEFNRIKAQFKNR